MLRSTSLLVGLVAAGHDQFLGPRPYCQASDSPFSGVAFEYFHLEDFEDHGLNVPGVVGSPGGVTSVVFGPTIHDSVDADDGAIDGSGLQGDDGYADGMPGVTWTFDAAVLGRLPTHAGLVWTDGIDAILFETFDEYGASLGTLTGDHANDSFSGETAEDRFYGVVHAGGISRITLWNGAGGGIEMDHLRYGAAAVPKPATVAARGFGLLAVVRRGRAWARRLSTVG